MGISDLPELSEEGFRPAQVVGSVRGSPVPPEQIRRVQPLADLMEGAGIKLSSVAADIAGVSSLVA